MEPILTEYLDQQQTISTEVRRTAKAASRLAGSVVTYSVAPVLRQAEAASTAIAASRVLPAFDHTPALFQMSEPNFTLVTPQSFMAQNPVWNAAQAASMPFQQRLQNFRDPCLTEYLAQQHRAEERFRDAARINDALKQDPVCNKIPQSARSALAESMAGGWISREQARSAAAWAKEVVENHNPAYAHLDADTRENIVTLTLEGYIDEGMPPDEAVKKVRQIHGR